MPLVRKTNLPAAPAAPKKESVIDALCGALAELDGEDVDQAVEEALKPFRSNEDPIDELERLGKFDHLKGKNLGDLIVGGDQGSRYYALHKLYPDKAPGHPVEIKERESRLRARELVRRLKLNWTRLRDSINGFPRSYVGSGKDIDDALQIYFTQSRGEHLSENWRKARKGEKLSSL